MRLHAADVHTGTGLEPANQDSRFPNGRAAHSGGPFGPETAADGRTPFRHFRDPGLEAVSRGQTINLNLWDYNDVAPAYFAAAEIAARDPKVGIIVIEVARPDNPWPIAAASPTAISRRPRKVFM